MNDLNPISTPLTKMFNMKYPIIGAPMFLVSDQNMVAAVGNAGGLGAVPALNYRPIEKYREALQEIKKRTNGPFGINIIVQKSNKYQDQHIDIALEEGVPLIITSLGSPKIVIERARQTSTKVFCDVVGLKHAKKVADIGAHGLIAVGSGAGGHGGETSLFALIPYLKKHIDLPIVAAGSISDGKGLLAALALGADGVYMGTRLIASQEAKVSSEYKNAIVHAGTDDIVSTDRVDGFPGNFIRTPLLEKVLKPNFIDNVLSQNARVKRMISLLRAGKVLFGTDKNKLSYNNVFSAGHGAGNIDSVLTIEEIIQNTVREYYQIKNRLP